MLIRCEKCSTLYELDEKLIPPQGAPVQCSKCQFVFKAYPPADQGRRVDTRDGGGSPPADTAPEPAARPDDTPLGETPDSGAAPEDLVREGGILASGAPVRTAPPSEPFGGETRHGPAGADVPRFTADGRPIRKVPFPTAEPSAGGVRPTAVRATPSRAPRFIDPASLMRWVIVAVVLVAIAVGAALAWRTYRGRGSGAGPRSLPGQSPGDQQSGTPGSQPRK